MASYLIDTNHLSRLFTADHPVHQQILRQLANGDKFYICVPVLTEMLFGIRLLPRAKQNIAEWKRIKPQFPCYIVDETDAEIAAELRAVLRPTGWQLKAMDALIAAVALRYELTLLTTDNDFSAILGLRTENWMVS